MASSIEARVPFLDPRLVEFCLALDPEEKLKDGLVKSVLRRAMRGTVPDEVLDLGVAEHGANVVLSRIASTEQRNAEECA